MFKGQKMYEMYVFVSFVFRKTKYGNYRVIIELLFLQKFCSNSNFNRKFDYEFGTQGLSEKNKCRGKTLYIMQGRATIFACGPK
jgi:hypothetical protein